MERYCPTLKYQLVYNTSIVCQVMLLRIWKSQVIVLLTVFLTTFLLISMKLGLSFTVSFTEYIRKGCISLIYPTQEFT